MGEDRRENRWEWIEGLKPQTPAEALATQYAKILATELEAWPPQVDWQDSAQQRHYAPLYAAGAPRPSVAALEAGFSRLRLELEHDVEALDHDARNHGLESELADPLEQLAARFVWLYASESFAELFERTESRFKRRHALITVDLVQRRFRASWQLES
jgi:hypothetical protein